ncbi:hypothetical protein KFK09_020668 [Dendrobium nobile]|uniref:CCHC-type domain-containing protein n=1 Tax=Dendrobium nobile TaxID=94219 RepID=A0A8T3AN35_DENNO|nr:hypothetical protein KFK09_020668 [Dendrobium nobile]
MAKRLVPAFNRILVEKIVPPTKTNTGILLPEKNNKLNSGKIVAVGPGIRDKDGKHIPLSLKEGDVVLLPEYGGTEVKLEEKRDMDPEQNVTDDIGNKERLELPTMNPEPIVTEGNVGEAGRALPTVADPLGDGNNATMRSFAQMMAVMTQMIKNSQTQANGSGSTSMDKNLKLFLDMKPPLFSSGEPLEAENWLMRIEKIMEVMYCPEDKKVTLVAYAFDGEAERWWRSQLQEAFGGRSSSQVSWGEFVKVFRDWFVPMPFRRQMQDKFNRLVQGDRSISQYEAEFTMLSRYAPHLIPNAEEKCHRFLSGLKDIIRQPLIPVGIEDYSTLVERARMIEMDLQATQRRRDFHKRKIEGRSKPTQSAQSSQSGVSTWKKPRHNISDSSASAATICSKCGRMHKGECLFGTNTCYWCHQPGHMTKSCHLLGQKFAIEARTYNNTQKVNTESVDI